MSETTETEYIIRSFDEHSGIMAVDYPSWGVNGMRINVRLEPNTKTGHVLSGKLLDDYLKKCKPPYVKIENSHEIKALVRPIDPPIVNERNFSMVPSHVFFSRFTDDELGGIWTGAANNPRVGVILFKLLKLGSLNIEDTDLKKQFQTLVEAKLLTVERMTEIMVPVAQ